MARINKARIHPGAVTRSLIFEELWQPNDDDDLELVSKHDAPSSDTSSLASNEDEDAATEEEEEDDGSLSMDASLEEIRTWLNIKCEEEEAKLDWTPEYDHRARRDSASKKGPSIAVLQRIRRGHGPRSSKFEDLLAPLRLTDDGEAPRYRKRPIGDTCKEMQDVLHEWNRRVGSVFSDNLPAREVLMDAMRDRIVFLDKAMETRWSASAHEGTCRKLLHAIHVFRPGTAGFDTQDPMELLTIIIAHLSYAIPDIDYDLKYRMLYTLVRERKYVASAFIANVNTKRNFEKKIAGAKELGNLMRAKEYKDKMDAWVRLGLQKNCNSIIQKVKIARRNIELRVLEEQQELAVLQTAQKLVLNDRISKKEPPFDDLVPRSTWWPEREDIRASANAHLKEKTSEHIDDLHASWRVTSRTTDEIKETNHARILTRAMKFDGRDLEDVTKDERQRVVRERMANPGTFMMMMDAAKSIIEVNGKAKEMAETASNMDRKLEEMLSAFTLVYDEYEALSKLVNSDPHMVVDGAKELEFR
ncbi:hypothetical protein CC86DRAFT_201375 [Ophiobolus disseminans]|uniref:Uncharacterized protein n=1 Tax=Ophiobolus disseminans TaxID=1469910 RepID=A0A6A7A5K7_9PLEO|nr:hypothetical protein CC86DRAFT_201375 [Ophiobolus disseminans]